MQPNQQPNVPNQVPQAPQPMAQPVQPVNNPLPQQYATHVSAPSQGNLQPNVNNLTSTTAPAPQQLQQAPVKAKQQAPQPKEPKLNKKQKEQLATAQNSLFISEIRENMVIMNDGSFRAVIACESINYDLMSKEERDGIEYSYQNFLNLLSFPIQIVIQSRKIDIKPYLNKLETIRSDQENMLLGVLMDDYLDFIFDISQQANIMRKDFFIVIPYKLGGDETDELSLKAMADNAISDLSSKKRVTINAANYSKAKDEIKNRVRMVLSGLMNVGVRAGQLPTQALGELYYYYYNPDDDSRGQIGELRQYTDSLFVKKGDGEAPVPGGVS